MGKNYLIPAAYLILLQDNKILLLRRFNTGFKDGQYSFIAGHVEHQETFTECVIREAKEEAGITINPEGLKVVHVMQRLAGNGIDNERIDLFFTTEQREGEIQNLEPNKCDDLSWFSLDDIPENTITYIKQAINCLRNKIYYSEYGRESR